jgi:membrane protein implicated in regulation of membrane protease activity
MTLDPVVIWFLLGLVLTLLEFAMPGVILIFFGVGALIVAATTYFGLTASSISQLLLFATVSILLLLLLRKSLKGRLYGHVKDVQDLSRNLDEFTGKSVVVTEDVVPGTLGGKVEFKGATWSAVSEDHLKAGEAATIIGIDGITLKLTSGKEE